MQGTDPAKSFLEKLKFGGAAAASVDNNSPPNSEGIIVRLLERQYASEPLSALGLKLNDDAEVVSTEPNSPAAKANIPPQYMIIYVNNQFVGSRADFEEIASQHLTLIIKLQTTTAMSELLAKMLDEEEKRENGQASMPIDTNELLRTTPRYGFLSAEHPMFLRWNHRIQTQREARQLLRQAARDAEEQQAKEALERIRQEMEEEEMKQRQLEQQKQQEKQEQEKKIVNIEKVIPNAIPNYENEFHLKRVQDESSFGRFDEVTEVTDGLNGEASAEELLKLIGAKPKEEIPAPVAVPEEDGEVRFLICPTEEYTLSNGMHVTISLKQRIGPLPKPPPGKPPKGILGLQVNTKSNPVNSTVSNNNEKICSFCYIRGHTEDECVEKKEQERKLALTRKERQVCRDYLRGRCTRTECVMRHVSQRSRSRSPRSRKRDRDRNHRSRERRRRGESRSRRHDSRRRSRRSESSERYRRRR
ncbi:uncharacterized protein TM35_000161480 [Trypanosoma theileri]|uniref:C3H1-type domain-containing protein n=1 Tax=Trypanosoma theileri TaxID=67003 RepID=A0A1X0NWL9_9TRYP|nr:uncharacterized protein TM35_000161480 [Trypanosoma theileri]ORC88510.1 hypothetical protein TM35_000161480 [Trypanosoma theileri]